MPKANFSGVVFNEHLGDNVGDLPAPAFTGAGNQTSAKTLIVPGVFVDDGYLITCQHTQ